MTYHVLICAVLTYVWRYVLRINSTISIGNGRRMLEETVPDNFSILLSSIGGVVSPPLGLFILFHNPIVVD